VSALRVLYLRIVDATTPQLSDVKRSPSKRAAPDRAKSAYFAHPMALVDKGAKIGAGTRVWAFAHVLSGAVVGKECNLCDHVFVEGGARIGDRVTVKSGVAVWDGVHVEKNAFLGPGCAFTNDLFPRSYPKRPKASWFVETLLREGCTLGANATIVAGNTVGRYAFVAAGAVVTREVPDHALVAGVPAKRVGWVCRCGTKLAVRRGKASCRECGDAYIETPTGLTGC
jgi:UDP-2-acetamido-3-amino-2,3-dideoxy-glucuronate N-acetyltransferase